MKKQQLSFLVPAMARDAHAELLAALGTEQNPAQWMTFMSAVTRLLPEVLSVGRPSAEAIARCAIGQLNFKSWAAMIEAPIEENGLGWNVSAWKAWRRAWATVQENQWLREQQLSSSEINSLANDLKRSETPFPASIEALNAMRAEAKGEAEQNKANTIAALTEQVKNLEKTESGNAVLIATLREQRTEGLTKIQEQAEIIGTLKTEKITAETAMIERAKESEKTADQLAKATSKIMEISAEIAQLRGQIEVLSKPAPAPRPLTRLEHFKAFVFGL